MNTQAPKEYPPENAYTRFSRVPGVQGSIQPSTTRNTHNERMDADRRMFMRGKVGQQPNGEAATESDLADLEQFNRELQAAIDAVDWSQPF